MDYGEPRKVRPLDPLNDDPYSGFFERYDV